MLDNALGQSKRLIYTLQVVLAFLLGAYIPLIITVAFYACGLIPPDFLNDYDRQFLRIKLRPSARWVTGLRKGFFAFSIQQLVLGIGILSAGFAKISEMIVFDFRTVIYMAWMSSTAHLFTLMLLHDRFLSSPLFRTLELLSMLVLLLMLCVALFPTTNWAWANSVLTRSGCSEPSYCSATQKSVSALWQIARQTNLTSGGVSPQGLLSYVIIIISYISQTTSLLQQRRQFFRNFFHKPLTDLDRTGNSTRICPWGKEKASSTNDFLQLHAHWYILFLTRHLRSNGLIRVPFVDFGCRPRLGNYATLYTAIFRTPCLRQRRTE